MSIKEQFWYQKRNNVMMKKGENMTKNKIRKQDYYIEDCRKIINSYMPINKIN